MAFLTCPDCRMSTQVSDDSIEYMCFGCFAQIIFVTCPECSFQQSIPARWQNAFSCGNCGERVAIPRVRLYSTATKAKVVAGYGFTYPRF
jgi:ribosomal protein S27E